MINGRVKWATRIAVGLVLVGGPLVAVAGPASALTNPTITSNATATATPGSTISDAVNVTGTSGPAGSGSDIVLVQLFGPSDPTCAGSAVFSSGVVDLDSSGNYTATTTAPATLGTYTWEVTYGGPTYNSFGPVCGGTNESTDVALTNPTITSNATPSAAPSATISDAVNVTGSSGPAGSGSDIVEVRLFGPADPTCAGSLVFDSGVVDLDSAGNYTATTNLATAPGTYTWEVLYGGPTYNSFGPVCGGTNETTTISVPLVFTTPPRSGPVSPSANLGPITVQLQDGLGNPVLAPAGGVVVSLSSTTTGTPFFSKSKGGPPVTTVKIPAGASSATFFYGDTAVGTPTITASATGYLSATQTETISAIKLGAAVGQSSPPVTVIFVNSSGGVLSIGQVTGHPASIGIVTDSCSNRQFPKNASCRFQIVFTPTQKGKVSGHVSIPTSAGTFTLAVTATGV